MKDEAIYKRVHPNPKATESTESPKAKRSVLSPFNSEGAAAGVFCDGEAEVLSVDVAFDGDPGTVPLDGAGAGVVVGMRGVVTVLGA
jgi:hypothetical protein